jgi:hypothetical protein
MTEVLLVAARSLSFPLNDLSTDLFVSLSWSSLGHGRKRAAYISYTLRSSLYAKVFRPCVLSQRILELLSCIKIGLAKIHGRWLNAVRSMLLTGFEDHSHVEVDLSAYKRLLQSMNSSCYFGYSA